jgi:hypothetical protein
MRLDATSRLGFRRDDDVFLAFLLDRFRILEATLESATLLCTEACVPLL